MITLRFLVACFLAVSGVLSVQAQVRHTSIIEGVVVDQTTRKPIESVNVFILESQQGTTTDHAGRFRLRIPLRSPVGVIFSHVAYDRLRKTYRLDRPVTLQIEILLHPRAIETGEVTVTGRAPVSEERTIFKISGKEIQQCGEKTMERKLHYLMPTVVGKFEDRMMHPEKDFTLYINGVWFESIYLDDIDPATVTKVLVWGANEAPPGFFNIRGGTIVDIETEQ